MLPTIDQTVDVRSVQLTMVLEERRRGRGTDRPLRFLVEACQSEERLHESDDFRIVLFVVLKHRGNLRANGYYNRTVFMSCLLKL